MVERVLLFSIFPMLTDQILSVSNGGSPKSGPLPLGLVFSNVVNNATYDAWPALCTLNDGRLFCVFRRGTAHGTADGVIHYTISDNRGVSWQTPVPITALGDQGYGHKDPGVCALKDGRVLVSYILDGHLVNKCRCKILTPSGTSFTLGKQQVIPDDYWNLFSGSCSNMVELPDGRWAYLQYGKNLGDPGPNAYQGAFSTAIIYSSDEGRTWTPQTLIARGNASIAYDEANMVVLPSGRMVVIIRTGNVGYPEFGYSLTYSDDGGGLWSMPTLVISSANAGKPCPVLLASGAIFMAVRYHNATGYTYAFTSWDGGSTWTSPQQIGANFIAEYAGTSLLSGGNVACVYAYDTITNQTKIDYQEFTDGFGLFSNGAAAAKSHKTGASGTWIAAENLASFTNNFGTIAAGATATTTTTVTGAAITDHVSLTLNSGFPLLIQKAYVSGANTVTIELSNPTAGGMAVNTVTGTVKVTKPV